MAVQLESTAGAIGKDLPENEQVALAHGHDADLETKQTTTATAASTDEEKRQNEVRASSASISSGSHNEADLEKGERNVVAASKNGTTAQDELANDDDPNVVDFDGPNDPLNPLNWPLRRKVINLVILSAMTFLTPLASSMFAPGVPELMRDFGSDSKLLATFVVSSFILGFAFGPLLIAPLSELYGRVVIYHVCNFGYIVFTLACAYAPNMGAMIAFRFFQGCWGVAPLTIGGGTIVDMIPPERRGRIMSIWSIGPLIGPVVGPVAGGFLAEASGWRWIFKVLACANGVVTIVAFIFLRESYPPMLLEWKTKRLQKETGNMELRSKLDLGLAPGPLFVRSIVRPTKMLFLSPICGLMSLFMAVLYGFLYLLFTTFTFVFEEEYQFSESSVGLVYIGIGIGFFMGLGIMAFSSDAVLKKLAARKDTGFLPEYRLPQLICAAPLLPISFLIYGWTTQFHTHWVVPLFGTLLLGIAMNIAFMAIGTYLVDTFQRYAASAMAANTVLRSIFGGVIPLFGLQMYNALGLGWGNSLLAFVALAMCPIPWLFYVYGERIRTSKRFQITF